MGFIFIDLIIFDTICARSAFDRCGSVCILAIRCLIISRRRSTTPDNRLSPAGAIISLMFLNL